MNSISFLKLDAHVLDHLKQIDGKEGNHSFGPIDFIYMINLDERPEKYEESLRQLSTYGIVPYRFSAVNGWKLRYEELMDIGLKFDSSMKGGLKATIFDANLNWTDVKTGDIGQVIFSHRLSRGAIGIIISHLSILKDAHESGYELIWVMEDDIQVIKDPRIIEEKIRSLNTQVGSENWDIFFTDKDTKSQQGNRVSCTGYAERPNFVPKNPQRFAKRKLLKEGISEVGARYGAYSMIINRRGIEKLLSFFEEFDLFLPIDMEYFLPNDIHLYCVDDDIISTRIDAPSDNGRPNYKRTLRD